jgi:erythromycin esterase-like protein
MPKLQVPITVQTLTLAPASCPCAPRNSFDRYGEDAQAYGLATGLGGYPSCADAAARAARDVIAARATLIARADGVRGEELAFAAACNAAVVRDAEKYYRNMFFAEELTWNLRCVQHYEGLFAIHFR